MAATSPRAFRARAVGRTGSFVSESARFASMPERQRAGHRRTGIAARASSRWTESDRAALELARTRVSAALAASECSKRPALSDRTAGSSRSSRAPGRIFRHTIKEAFREWLFERERERAERVSVTRPTKPPLPNPNAGADEKNRSRTASNAEYSHGIPDVSVATKTKVRAWVEARRAETHHHSTPTQEKRTPRDVQTESRVFVSTNHLTAARVSTDRASHAPFSRHADYVVKCAHLAFPNVTGSEEPGADEHGWPGYFEENTGRFVPAFCARRVACRFENAEEDELYSRRTRNATFVFCQNCHDAFLVRELTRCDSRTSACHACGARVPRSATTKDGRAEGKTTCVFCAFAAKARDSEKKKKRVVRGERETDGLSRTESDSSSFSETNRPACAFLDADDVPGLDALRAAVAKDAPGRVFLRWDAVARRARNAETDARWRVSSRESNLRGDARLSAARPRSDTPETDAPVNWGFLHAGMPAPFAADDFPARHAREFY